MFQHDYFLKLKCNLITKIIKKHFLHKPQIADFGCGTGEAIVILSPFVDFCVGIDSSPMMIQFAKKKSIPNADFFLCDCRKSSLARNVVDLVFSMTLFHHVEGFFNKIHILKEMMRVAKPNGLILIFEHNPLNPITRLIFQREPLDREARMVSPLYMKKLCKYAEYKQFSISYLAYFPKQLAMLSRSEFLLERLPFGGQYVVIAQKDR